MKHVVTEEKQQRVKRRLIKGGMKAARRQQLDPADVGRLKSVRVQMMPPLLRVTLAITGLVMLALPFMGWLSLWWMLLLLPLGLILLLIGANGRKKEIGNTIAEVGGELAGRLFQEVVVGIFSSL